MAKSFENVVESELILISSDQKYYLVPLVRMSTHGSFFITYQCPPGSHGRGTKQPGRQNVLASWCQPATISYFQETLLAQRLMRSTLSGRGTQSPTCLIGLEAAGPHSCITLWEVPKGTSLPQVSPFPVQWLVNTVSKGPAPSPQFRTAWLQSSH